jgi:hypothetical protein
VRRLRDAVDDGYRTPLAPGLRSSDDGRRLVEELALAATRLEVLASDPPGLYGEVAAGDDIEERSWLAFLIAYLFPLELDDPFAAIAAARTSWGSGDLPSLEGVETGPRTAHDPARGPRTLEAYRAWAGRAGSQAAAIGGEPGWSPAKRALGIGDPLLLERRAAQLAEACRVPLEALDLGFENWERGERVTAGLGPGAEPAEAAVQAAYAALEL